MMQITKKIFLTMFILSTTSSHFYAIEPITTIAICAGISTAFQSYFIGQSIHDKVYPDEPTQLNVSMAKEKLKYINAKNNFEKCLLTTTPQTERNARNIPMPCRDLASAFIQCGGKNEMIDMIQNFDDARKDTL